MAAILQTILFFTSFFVNENVSFSFKISLNFAPEVPIDNMATIVKAMTWCRAGDKPLHEPMMAFAQTRHQVSIN